MMYFLCLLYIFTIIVGNSCCSLDSVASSHILFLSLILVILIVILCIISLFITLINSCRSSCHVNPRYLYIVDYFTCHFTDEGIAESCQNVWKFVIFWLVWYKLQLATGYSFTPSLKSPPIYLAEMEVFAIVCKECIISSSCPSYMDSASHAGLLRGGCYPPWPGLCIIRKMTKTILPICCSD